MTTSAKQQNERAAKALAEMCRAYFEALNAAGFDAERSMRIIVAIVGGARAA